MIHGKLQIFFQMFSQISRTPNFERSFRVKRCGLYAGVYGMHFAVCPKHGHKMEGVVLHRVVRAFFVLNRVRVSNP